MLSKLIIRDFVIIDEIELDFESGFNVITGETGSGKSLLVAAILQLAGARMENNLIKKGRDKAIIQGQFFLDSSIFRSEYGLDEEGGGEIIITRELHKSGKSVAKVNGLMVNNRVLKRISSELLSVFGQNDKMKVFDEKEQLLILDSFVLSKNNQIFSDIKNLSKIHKDLLSKKEELLFTDEAAIEREKELIEYQMSDIDRANLSDEDNLIEDEYRRAKNSVFIAESLSTCIQQIDGEDYSSILKNISSIVTAIHHISEFSDSYTEIIEKLEDMRYSLMDIKEHFNGDLGRLNDDPNYIYELEKRLDEVSLLKKKYGNSVEEILAFRKNLEDRLLDLDSVYIKREEIDREIESVEKSYFEKARILSDLRRKAADKISKDIARNLKALNFKTAEFKIHFENNEKIDSLGIDSVKFMLKINAGTDFDELKKIASGGELSRIMLAIQESIAKKYKIPVLIFDEIDAGISGRTGNALAKKLYSLSLNHQLIVVSHLLQVAIYGDNHYLIEKVDEGGFSKTKIEHLNKEKRIEEVYRLMSGEENSEDLRKEAGNLIKNTEKVKLEIKKALNNDK